MKKIGLLDSGLGGFSLLKDLLNESLNAEYYFISDNENVPYGGKSQDFMLQRMLVLVERLLDKDVQAIVVACNTATVETIEILRQRYDVPFIGIEPYINYLNHSINKKVSLILTEATYNSKRFKSLQSKYDPQSEVKVIPLKNLALIVEKLFYTKFKNVKADIDSELDLIEIDLDGVLVLGCTHYPLIRKYIESYLKIKTIDPNKFVINELVKKLNLLRGNTNTSFQFCYNAQESWNIKDIHDFDIFF